MQFDPRRVPARPLILLCATLGLGACVAGGPLVATPSACSTLLPPEWLAGVPSAPLPDGETVADLAAFSDAQTGQLDKANDRYVSGVGIVARCEARDAKAVSKSRPQFLGLF